MSRPIWQNRRRTLPPDINLCPLPAMFPTVSSRHLRTECSRQTWVKYGGWHIFEGSAIKRHDRKLSCMPPTREGCKSTRFSSCTSPIPSQRALCAFRSLSTNTDRRALTNSSAENLHRAAQRPAAATSSISHQRRVTPWLPRAPPEASVAYTHGDQGLARSQLRSGSSDAIHRNSWVIAGHTRPLRGPKVRAKRYPA